MPAGMFPLPVTDRQEEKHVREVYLFQTEIPFLFRTADDGPCLAVSL